MLGDRRLSFFLLLSFLQIIKIENLGHLTELRVLNLAGNEIVHVCNVSGMRALAELNLRRNKIGTVVCIFVSVYQITWCLLWHSSFTCKNFSASKIVAITYY